MSGSNSSSGEDWRASSGDGAPGNDKCAISEKTILNSPNAAVIATLSVGSLLAIYLETVPRKRLVAKNDLGAIAGAITSARLVDLIECVEGGFEYISEVLAVNGGRVEIEIRPK